MAHQMARGASRTLLIKALAGAMVLAAVSAPLASASGPFGVDAAASFAGAESAAIEGADASVGGRRGLQQVNCADICKSSPKNPVCGVDGKTYDNACIPICGQKKIKYWGKCSSKPCLCPPVFAPVCAGGKTYLSSCFAKCAGAGGAKDGYCGSQCKCPSTSSPVCGIDGKTYDNWCKSVCGGTFPYYSGSCDARIGTCKCPSVNDPVCVSSVIETTIPGVGTTKTPIKTTYSSPCLAKCQGGATTWAKGVCADYPLYDSSSYTCGCSLELKPVCAIIPVINRTVTLNSKCAADCSGYKVQYDGVCKDECLCPANAKPVCVDGKKPYLSACQARCKGAKTWTEGACKQCASCPTPMSINDYACGADGLQYMSKCAAECAGTEVAYQGLCKGLGGKK